MFSAFERMIAFRYLRSRRKEGFISVIAGFSFVGIALGVATLIVVMAVMNGFRSEITSKILGLSGHISVASYEGRIHDFDDFVGSLENVDGVITATPVIDGQVMATTKFETTGAMVKGIRLKDILVRPLISGNINDGSITEFYGSDTIIIGSQLAMRLGVVIGDKTDNSFDNNLTTIVVPQQMETFTIIFKTFF